MPCCELENKSGKNFAASELLHKQLHPASAAHCAYYSCFQLMKHIAFCVIKKSEKEANASKAYTHEGCHELIINIVVNYLIDIKKENEGGQREVNEVNSKIVQLKKLRNDADYFNKPFENQQAQAAITLSREISRFLKANF